MTGRTLGGLQLYPASNQLDREGALRLWTESNTWFSTEVGKKGQIKVGQLADLAVLSDDYFSVPGDAIQDITSVLTLLGGKAVYADAEFKDLAPPLPPAMPDWSPVRTFGGYQKRASSDPQRKYAFAAACGCGTVVRRARACARMGRQRSNRRSLLLGSAWLLVLGGVT